MRASTQSDHLERIRRVQRFMEAHLDQEQPLDVLAQTAALSLHHFHRVFRGVVGESVEAHLRRLRLERAARGLRAADARVSQLAAAAGYRSHEAFTRAFFEHFGQSPSDYRRQPKPRARRAASAGTAALPAVELRRYGEIPVIALRHVGSWRDAPRIFRDLARWSGARGMSGMMHCLVPDDPEITPEDKLRLDACLEGTPRSELGPGMSRALIPGGLYAVALHRGPWESLEETYLGLIGRWLPTTSFRPPPEPVVETYLDGAEVPSAQRRTEVRMRVGD
jgi:AraC family transcriptional regulator